MTNYCESFIFPSNKPSNPILDLRISKIFRDKTPSQVVSLEVISRKDEILADCHEHPQIFFIIGNFEHVGNAVIIRKMRKCFEFKVT